MDEIAKVVGDEEETDERREASKVPTANDTPVEVTNAPAAASDTPVEVGDAPAAFRWGDLLSQSDFQLGFGEQSETGACAALGERGCTPAAADAGKPGGLDAVGIFTADAECRVGRPMGQ